MSDEESRAVQLFGHVQRVALQPVANPLQSIAVRSRHAEVRQVLAST